MKKILLIISIILLVTYLVSCESKRQQSTTVVNSSESDSETEEVSTETEVYMDKYIVIDRLTVLGNSTVEKNIPDIPNYQLLNYTLNLKYVETYVHFVGDYKVHKYKIVNATQKEFSDEESYIHLLDGSNELIGIANFRFKKIDLNASMTDEQVQKNAETALSDLVDFSSYTNANIQSYEDGRYYISRFKEQNGLQLDDVVKISINPNGYIYMLWNFPTERSFDEENSIISMLDDETANDLLEQKLSIIYNKDNNEYVQHEIRHKMLSTYNDKPCIIYTVSVSFKVKDSGYPLSELRDVLIALK